MQEKQLRWLKTSASPSATMYRKAESVASPPENFELPNGCKLAEDNRWVIMAKLIPWSEFLLKNMHKTSGQKWVHRLNRFG